jgi:hypothetical protein
MAFRLARNDKKRKNSAGTPVSLAKARSPARWLGERRADHAVNHAPDCAARHGEQRLCPMAGKALDRGRKPPCALGTISEEEELGRIMLPPFEAT